jgi:Ribbon-helix-helix protein, copG family
MSKYRRVTVTVPADVLKAADATAKRFDRSRSWVVAEALQRYAAASAAAAPGAPRAVVREGPAPPYDVQRAFRAAELSRLEGDLALTPEQRVRVAEEIARTVPAGQPRPRFRRVVQFDSYDDYLEWRRFAELRP